MVEPAAGTVTGADSNAGNGTFNTEGGTEPHWSDAHELITADKDLAAFAKKFGTEADMAKSGHELEKKLGSSFRIPDNLDLLSEDQKAELHGKIRQLRNVPDSPDGYEIKRPEKMPEGMNYDENLENAFRQHCHERGRSNTDVQDDLDFYHDMLFTAQAKYEEAQAKAATKAETEFRIRCGPEFDNVMEGIKRVRMRVSEELGLIYTNDKGETASKLDDCLDGVGLGNKVPILQMLNWIYTTFLSEGEPIEGSGSEQGKGGSFFDYKKVDK